MRTSSILVTLAGTAIAQNIATVTEIVTVPDATPMSTSIQQFKQLQSTSTASDTVTTASSTFATSISPAATDVTSAASSPAPTSTASYGSEPGAPTGVDTDAGASGSGSSFSISTGGLAAIIVIVILVAIFAIASLTLWIIAKHRQETMRTSLARISRRITAPLTPGARPAGNSNRRTTVHRGEFAEPGKPRGHKRGLRIDETEMEKGGMGSRADVSSTGGKKEGWTQRLWGNDWR